MAIPGSEPWRSTNTLKDAHRLCFSDSFVVKNPAIRIVVEGLGRAHLCCLEWLRLRGRI